MVSIISNESSSADFKDLATLLGKAILVVEFPGSGLLRSLNEMVGNITNIALARSLLSNYYADQVIVTTAQNLGFTLDATSKQRAKRAQRSVFLSLN